MWNYQCGVGSVKTPKCSWGVEREEMGSQRCALLTAPAACSPLFGQLTCLRALIRILGLMQVTTDGKKIALRFNWDVFLMQFAAVLHKSLCLAEGMVSGGPSDWGGAQRGLA